MGKPLLKEDEVPSGGIADFIMSSDEIKQIEMVSVIGNRDIFYLIPGINCAF